MQNCWKLRATGWPICALALVVCVGSLSADDTREPSPRLKVVRNEDGFLVSDGGVTVLQYQLKTKSLEGKFARSNYVHPLNDLDGNPVTEDFPEDHKHHRGIFWAWHQVWVGNTRLGDPWLCQDFEWITKAGELNSNADGSVTISASVVWQSNKLLDEAGTTIPIAEETVQITVYPQTPDYRVVEFRLAFRALRPEVRIGGSEDEKGYGGFSPRIRLNSAQRFVSAGELVEPVKNAIKAGPWVDIADERVGVAILTHPQNPGAPESWILRRARSMQNARFPGPTPVSLPTDVPLIQRYQLVIHRGTDVKVPLKELHESFAKSLH